MMALRDLVFRHKSVQKRIGFVTGRRLSCLPVAKPGVSDVAQLGGNA
jgi:hypothetical protein